MQVRYVMHVRQRTTFLLACLVGFCGMLPLATLAQPTTAPSDRRGAILARVEQAMEDLGLSQEQKDQVREILETARNELLALDPQQRRGRARELLREVNEQVMSLLDEDQKAAYRERMEQLRERLNQGANAGGRRQGRQDGRQAQGPSTQPAGRPAALIEQLRNALEQLQLDEDIKTKADQIMRETRTKLQTLREEAAGDMQLFRTRARELMNEARQDLEELLSNEQREKLRELIEQAVRSGPRPDRGNRPDRDAAPPPAPAPATAPGEAGGQNPPGPGDGPRAALDPPQPLRLGQAAPEFALTKLDGRPVQLSSFKGRVLVLLFGNYSSPPFRERAPQYEQLRKQFANRVEFLIVYTRESHAVGEWEIQRNRDAKITVEQPTTLDQRKALAQQARQALKITLPIAIDSMDDKTAREYGGFTSAAVVIGRDGNVVDHRRHADPYALRSTIEKALASRPAGAQD